MAPTSAETFPRSTGPAQPLMERMWAVMADNPVVAGAGSAILAIILGLPWTLLTTSMVRETSTAFNLLLVAAGMFAIAGMLLWLCRWFDGLSIARPTFTRLSAITPTPVVGALQHWNAATAAPEPPPRAPSKSLIAGYDRASPTT
jgi:hypothetical protein